MLLGRHLAYYSDDDADLDEFYVSGDAEELEPTRVMYATLQAVHSNLIFFAEMWTMNSLKLA
jgi:hypothetical protein